MSQALIWRRAVTAAVAAVALAVGGLAAAATARAATHRLAIPATHPPWATTHGNGAAPAVNAGTVNARIYLAGRDSVGLTAYASAVSTPGNALYRHYLTPARVRSQFGPTAAQITAIESWARSAGLAVTGVDSQLAGYVSVTGSVAAARSAFGVSFGKFKGPDGHMYRAPEQAASAPSSVASSILTISGLDTAPHVAKPADALPPPGPNYWVAPPCSSYYAQKIATSEPTAYGIHQPWNNCGYTQRQIRAAYGARNSGMTGKGQTVAVVDAYASPTMPGDANQFDTVTGDRPFRPGQYEQYLPSTTFTDTAANLCDAQGWYTEQTLDIEAVHGQAPGANVRFVAAASCLDPDLADSLAFIVNNHLASIVTNSWGDPADDETTLTAVFDQIFQAGAAEGIGFFFSSGDLGYESPSEDPASDVRQVDYPTSSPWVTSVGGTSLAIGKQNNYEFETSWGTLNNPLAPSGTSWSSPPPGVYPADYDGSSGGGTSTLYQQPFYQRGVVPTALSTQLPDGTISPTPMRVVPDVSALADPSTGMLIGQTTLQPDGTTYAFSLSRNGGTSVACPVFAGIEADAQQAAGYPLGFANPVIYDRYGTSAYRDVTDFPFGPGIRLAQVRNNYTDPSTKLLPLVTYLRTLGVDGEGADALPATSGYDDSTGVGSPDRYIQSFFH
ncbi:MAG TPA: S53 family serine peptidase [Streptosporangiaceae bacterium]|nr:S53 family serine peptidase [Streptosporangiaceae bacterium]